jgi:non-lysosomal glucosylceramidase
MPIMAGPFTREDFETLLPADKKLAASWVKSLYERGEPEVWRGDDLKWIGMPIGGICSGQLYLSGDGRLWHWDIFNQHINTGVTGPHYVDPLRAESFVEQKFELTINGKSRPLDQSGFKDVSFRGEYPIARVAYRAEDVAVELEAFSPFIPLNTDDSSLPATIMNFTVTNTGSETIEGTLAGSLENVVARNALCLRQNRIVAAKDHTFLECSARALEAPKDQPKPDVLFEDWNQEVYQNWKAEGVAFGTGPVKRSDFPGHQGDPGGDTGRVANSHAAAPGGDSSARDNATGRLTSKTFTIERRLISFWIGGGNYPHKTCLNLLVDGKVLRSATGGNVNAMTVRHFVVEDLIGRPAVLEIVDAQDGTWAHVGVGRITFTDHVPVMDGAPPLEALADFGTMGLSLHGPPADLQDAVGPVGILGRSFKLAPGASETVSFVVAWHFPNLTLPVAPGGRYYATRFESALKVADYLASDFDRLSSQTRLWRDTWYDSTLPYWFLDRTMLNTSVLATSTSFRFKNGRFYGWEGVGCCDGTCGHVWYYGHAMARLFPDLERDIRERVDFGLAQRPDGSIIFRAERGDTGAFDAQAGYVLRALREHQMSSDDTFLKRIWQGVKRATEWLIAQDINDDGLVENGQHHTLDTEWYGPVAWLCGLYLAALQAAAGMAREMGDPAFEKRCSTIYQAGKKRMVAQLFDGEYFINRPDPAHPYAVNSGTGCHIDQVIGQSWTWQIGLPRILPEKETVSALRSLWRYSFVPDMGPYRQANPHGRWFAVAGEAGMIVCSFPRKDWDFEKSKGDGSRGGPPTYFHETWTGFEYQVASHMIWEGMIEEGLAVTRAVHDRYAPSRRNPYNEVECGDHYARAMASYGVFTAACGYEHHGPKGHIGFNPKIGSGKFKAAFTAAEGWGSFTQTANETSLQAQIAVRHGKLRLKSVSLGLGEARNPKAVRLSLGDKPVAGKLQIHDGMAKITLPAEITIEAGETLHITLA